MRINIHFIWMVLLWSISTSVNAQVFAPADGSKKEEAKEYFTGDLSGFQVSPSGKGVAYLKYEGKRWVLYWDNINGGRETRVSKEEQANVVDFRWVGDDAIVYSTGDGEIGSELHRYETFNKAYNRLTSTPVWVKFCDSHYYNNGTTLLIRKADDVTSTKVYSILPGMKELKHIASGHGVSWVEGLGNGGTYSIQRVDDGSQFVNALIEGGEKLGSIRGLCIMKGLALASKTEASIYALSDLNRNNMAFVTVNMRTGAEEKVVYEREKCNVQKVLFSFHSSKPVMLWYDGAEKGFEAVDSEFKSILNSIVEKLPTTAGFDIVNSDLSGNVWIVSIMNPGIGRIYYHYNVSNRELKSFGKHMVSANYVPVTEYVLASNGDNIKINYYLPEEVNAKSIGVLVFRDAPWEETVSSSMDDLIQRLVGEGMLVADIDMGYSEIGRKKHLYAGYDQLVDRMINEVSVIQKNMVGNYGLINSMLAIVGEGIGCRAALRITAAHTSIVLRSAFINAAPETKGYLLSQFPIERNTKDFVIGYGEGNQSMTIPYLARSPLFIYDSSKSNAFTSSIEPAIKKFTQEGKTPESLIVGSGLGENISRASLKLAGDKLVEYLRN
jgi:dipeptidyl aminopeptidase/acylaminoacyl peptidase